MNSHATCAAFDENFTGYKLRFDSSSLVLSRVEAEKETLFVSDQPCDIPDRIGNSDLLRLTEPRSA